MHTCNFSAQEAEVSLASTDCLKGNKAKPPNPQFKHLTNFLRRAFTWQGKPPGSRMNAARTLILAQRDSITVGASFFLRKTVSPDLASVGTDTPCSDWTRHTPHNPDLASAITVRSCPTGRTHTTQTAIWLLLLQVVTVPAA